MASLTKGRRLERVHFYGKKSSVLDTRLTSDERGCITDDVLWQLEIRNLLGTISA